MIEVPDFVALAGWVATGYFVAAAVIEGLVRMAYQSEYSPLFDWTRRG